MHTLELARTHCGIQQKSLETITGKGKFELARDFRSVEKQQKTVSELGYNAERGF